MVIHRIKAFLANPHELNGLYKPDEPNYSLTSGRTLFAPLATGASRSASNPYPGTA